MRTLVAYGTKYGSTADVAKRIAEVLRSNGLETAVLDLRQNAEVDVSSYDLVVIGSGIAYGSWSKDARAFLDKHNDRLKQTDLAIFASCGDLFFSPERGDEHRKKYLEMVASEHALRPISMGLFGGVLDFNKYGFLVNGMLGMMRASRKDMESKGIDTSKPFDFRDWKQIEDWAGSLVKDGGIDG